MMAATIIMMTASTVKNITSTDLRRMVSVSFTKRLMTSPICFLSISPTEMREIFLQSSTLRVSPLISSTTHEVRVVYQLIIIETT